MSDYDYADSPGWAIAEARRRRDTDAHAAWLALPASAREAILAERAAADAARRESSDRCRALAWQAEALYRKVRSRPRRQETAEILDAAMWKVHMPLSDDTEPQLVKMIRVAVALIALLDAIEQRAAA